MRRRQWSVEWSRCRRSAARGVFGDLSTGGGDSAALCRSRRRHRQTRPIDRDMGRRASPGAMARNNRPSSSRSVKKRDTWDMLRGWQVNAIPDEEDETGIYCWGKRKTDVDPYTNFKLWTKLYRGWDPFLCDITTKCTAIENMSGFIDESLDDHLKKDATRKRDGSSQVAVESGTGNEDNALEHAETATEQTETAIEQAETTPGETEEVTSFSQAAANIQVICCSAYDIPYHTENNSDDL
ncbi:hypothetical protein NP493_4g14021 [Ridgeia piscesae]|uniref:Uncharacterized protein n=1 Tax=Ridgeia piscesae TaxID=27915 RepID=A0AAD9PFR3_RIDPI|nr:hypothetical protein NP493_4g14021 [Ridgeia piscesae]